MLIDILFLCFFFHSALCPSTQLFSFSIGKLKIAFSNHFTLSFFLSLPVCLYTNHKPLTTVVQQILYHFSIILPKVYFKPFHCSYPSLSLSLSLSTSGSLFISFPFPSVGSESYLIKDWSDGTRRVRQRDRREKQKDGKTIKSRCPYMPLVGTTKHCKKCYTRLLLNV